MNDRDRQALLDIINSAHLTHQYLIGKTKTDFEGNRMLQDAIVRRLEIVGEAATRLSDEARQTLSHIPWQQIIGMRNIMIHQYDRVDLQLVWETATQILPQLASNLAAYV